MALGRLTSTPYLVLFVLLGAVGVGTASAVGIITFSSPLDMSNNLINNLADPISSSDAATKGYVDSLFSCEGGAAMCSVGVGECQRGGINICVAGNSQCSVVPGSPSSETCDNLDNDCDSSTDEDFPTKGNSCSVGIGECENTGNLICKVDGSGVECDVESGVPSTEFCDSLDNDCDGTVDEEVTTTFYEDTDFDGFGNLGSSIEACSQPTGFVTDNTDCDDNEPNTFPGAAEICDGQDNDCDTLVDEGGVCETCGNNVVEGTESCDGTDLALETCATQGFDGGTLSCQPSCIFDSSLCSTCGNGIIEGIEVCDDGNMNNFDDCTNSCLPGG